MPANAYTRASGDLSVLVGNWVSVAEYGAIAPSGCMAVVPRPFGTTRVNNYDAPITTVTDEWTEILSYVPSSEYVFMLGKILVTWTGGEEQIVRVKIDDEVVAMYHASTYVMDWFAPGVVLDGDGTKKVVIDAKPVGAAAELSAFIHGDLSE